MKSIPVSTDVFAAIWAKRKTGEESEDAILRRLLGEQVQPIVKKQEDGPGITIEEFDVHFEEGEKIFRTYKGTDYVARANSGRWFLENDSQYYPSLHKLSFGVVGGRENAWWAWKIETGDGEIKPIHKLRNPDKVKSIS